MLYLLETAEILTVLLQIMKELEINASENFYNFTNSSFGHEYGFRVRASTIVGDGEFTREVVASNVNKGMGMESLIQLIEILMHWKFSFQTLEVE